MKQYFDFEAAELKAVLLGAFLMGVRLLGLFMLLPVLPHLSAQLPEVSLVQLGMIIGVYGLSQALLQLPLGILSDRYGRKTILTVGLLLFGVGSVIAYTASSVEQLIIGRAIQGMGAIGAVTLAFVADHTRPERRTRAMAVVGITIGIAFCLSFIIGPMLDARFGFRSLFGFSAVTAVIGGFLVWCMPDAPTHSHNRRISWADIRPALTHSQLWRFYIGIMTLHAIFSMSFQWLPQAIEQQTQLTEATVWQFYLPVFVMALVLMGPFMRIAHRDMWVKQVSRYAIVTIVCTLGLLLLPVSPLVFFIVMGLFFTAFNILEAALPAWTSRAAPPHHLGTTMGLFSTAQFMGIWLGGMLGGILSEGFGQIGIWWACVLFGFIWFMIATTQPQEPT